jgi:hypothetical protein
VKEKWRGKILKRIDRCMEIATGLHNLRIITRKTTYEKAEKRIDELLFFLTLFIKSNFTMFKLR